MLFLVPVQVLIFRNPFTETHDEFRFLAAKQKCITRLRDLDEDLATWLRF